jgi:hypothetical protein
MPGNVPTGLAWYKTFGYLLRNDVRFEALTNLAIL